LHTRPRVQRAPGVPCASDQEGKESFWQSSGELRREIAKLCLDVIARSGSDEAIQSSQLWIASLRSQ